VLRPKNPAPTVSLTVADDDSTISYLGEYRRVRSNNGCDEGARIIFRSIPVIASPLNQTGCRGFDPRNDFWPVDIIQPASRFQINLD
jgi:hypothetical protein